ncbi:MAG: hypothetical protein ACKO7W_06725 [Elainella sp.]
MAAEHQGRGKIGLLGQITIGLVVLGLCLRLAHLEQKVFWVDEVATAIRIAGHTRTELTTLLSDGQPRTPVDLLAYQQLAPDQPLSQTWDALRHSPEHAPLYFLLLRIWAGLLGSSVVALRGFSVLCSVILIGVFYWLGQELGQELSYGLGQELPTDGTVQTSDSAVSTAEQPVAARAAQTASYLAAGLTALSPLLIAYGQEARPYSLWLLLLALNSGLLLRALRLNRYINWSLYGLTLVLSCYTSLLTGVVALGQMLYVSLAWPQRWRRFGLIGLATGAALLPWLVLIGQSWPTLQANTTWMRLPLGGLAKLATWFYTIAILYFDVPVVTHPVWIAVATLVCATAVVAVIGLAFYRVYRITSRATWLFILTLALALPVALIGLDWLINGRYSTAPRYWLPFHLGAQLAVALWLAAAWNQDRQPDWRKFRCEFKGSPGLRARLIAGFLVAVCLLSNLLHLGTSPRYLKTRSLNNPAIAAVVNQASRQPISLAAQPLLLAEPQNTMDLLSLSHNLDPQTQIQIFPRAVLLSRLQQLQPDQTCDRPLFLFNPSPELRQQLQPISSLKLTPAYQPQLLFPGEFALSLWRLGCPNAHLLPLTALWTGPPRLCFPHSSPISSRSGGPTSKLQSESNPCLPCSQPTNRQGPNGFTSPRITTALPWQGACCG